MFFFKKKPKYSIVRDVHAHLIPGVDDGPKTMAESLELVRSLASLGYQSLTATSHVYGEYYPNTKQGLTEGFEELKITVQEAGIPIILRLGAEYQLDDFFEKNLKNDEILSFDSKNVLIETSFFQANSKVQTYIFQLQTKGYKPILAHPERYPYMTDDTLTQMKERGVLLQINLLSLAGNYGPEVEKRANQLIKRGLIDLFGTDAHHIGHSERLKDFFNSNTWATITQKITVLN